MAVKPRVTAPAWYVRAMWSMFVLAGFEAGLGLVLFVRGGALAGNVKDGEALAQVAWLYFGHAAMVVVFMLLLKFRIGPARIIAAVLMILGSVMFIPIGTICGVIALIGLFHPTTMAYLYPNLAPPTPARPVDASRERAASALEHLGQ
jgi:hypothetical protein